MTIEETREFLQAEKERLFQAAEFIHSFYKQIASSVVSLRDSIFKHAFYSDQEWKEVVHPENRQFFLEEFELENSEGIVQNNSEYIINVLNNIYAMENCFFVEPGKIVIEDIENIRAVNTYTKHFVERLYSRQNFTFLTDQGYGLANTVKNNIMDRLDDNIAPFFDYLESILKDEYRLALREELKNIVGTYKSYIENPFNYDALIKQRCRELELRYNQDIILNIVVDLSMDEASYLNDIILKYKNDREAGDQKNSLQLKEVAARFLAQQGNIRKLEIFFSTVQKVFQPVTFWEKLAGFFKRLFSGRGNFRRGNAIYFTYSSSYGRLEPKNSSVAGLKKQVALLNEFLGKFRNNLDFYNYTKNSNPQVLMKEIENIIDNCISDFTNIYEQCTGFREWLISPKNAKYLNKISDKKKEEFNDLLLSLNYTLIVSKQYIRDLEKKS